MRFAILSLFVALSCVTTGLSQSSGCPDGSWTGPFTVTFNVSNGTTCCAAGGTYCWKITNGVPDIFISSVWVDADCGSAFTVNDLKNKLYGIALQEPGDGLNLQIPPCSTGVANAEVRYTTSNCGTWNTRQESYPCGNAVCVRNVKEWFWCATIYCIKQCSICYNGQDPCNPTKQIVTRTCDTIYYPIQECPQCSPTGCPQ